MMREHGALIIDGKVTEVTNCCPHCGMHFVMRKGSGVRRGFCMKCGGITCGKPECGPCIPIEARLEHAEGKKTLYDDVIKDLESKGAILL